MGCVRPSRDDCPQLLPRVKGSVEAANVKTAAQTRMAFTYYREKKKWREAKKTAGKKKKNERAREGPVLVVFLVAVGDGAKSVSVGAQLGRQGR